MGLTLDELKSDEKIYTINEIEILIDNTVLPHTKENQIDFISNTYGQGFSIAPVTGSSCSSSGCSGC
ncbi:hypothetical protein SAMN05660420_02330 [Desulfuromusa kysingii]|uniref:HesB-like selenoprotein n=1 Tax=Desulfuromusa kysingii TaxID=37625 RepID=A0A1H4BXW8_9BACT|nr:hypothetical protein [Desulfuromusa kysingii]SEA52923.1 hypothetical protein SAMN05660420_02330 [Desulfuromusa kysingii]